MSDLFLLRASLSPTAGYLNYDELLVAKNVCRLWRGSVGYLINRRPVVFAWLKDEKCYLKRDEENHSPFYKLFYEKDDRLNRLDHNLVSSSWKQFRFITEYHECIRKLILSNPYLISFLNSFTNLEELQLLTESWLCKDFQLDLKRHYWEHLNNEHLEFENLDVLDEVFVTREYKITLKREESNFLYLKLAKLRKLHFISDYNFKKIPIVLACPNLRSVTTDVNVDYFRFKFPSSVEEITCEENTLALMQFRNLRKLTCYYFNQNYAFFLPNFRNLQEFYFYKLQMEDLFVATNFDPIRVFYKDVQLLPNQTWQSQLRSLSPLSLNDHSLDFYSKNVKLLSETTDLMHKELRVNCLKHVAPQVLAKLGNLRQVYINYDHMNRENYVEVFKASNLKKLIIKSSFISSVDQRFLNQIPVHCPSLSLISLDDFQDLNFCLNLKFLKCLRTEQFFNFQHLQKMLDYLPSLAVVEVHVAVDIYKFEVVEEPAAGSRPKPGAKDGNKLKVICSYNHQKFLEEPKKRFISLGNRNCIWKLYEIFFANYKE